MKKLSLILLFFLFFMTSFVFIACDKDNNPQEDKLVAISLTGSGKVDYNVGDDFDPAGFTLELQYESSTKEIPLTLDMCDIKKFTSSGNVNITISYEGFFASLKVNVKESATTDEVVRMEVTTSGEAVYSSEIALDLSGYVFKLVYKSGKEETILGTDSKFSANITGFEERDDSYEQDIIITYDKKVSVVITVRVLSEWDYEDYIEEKEITDFLKKLESDCAKAIPAEATTDLVFPTVKDYNYRFKLSWDTSDSKVLSVTGKVNQQEEDKDVLITLDVYRTGTSELLKHLEYNVHVPGLGPVEFEDLSNKKIVMAYFYEGNYREMTKSDGNKIDIMCYCFGRVDNGKLTITELRNIDTVMRWRREYKMRVLLSIGGGASGGFSGAVKDDASRKKFVNSIMDVIKEYGFDGIDMDWEYPGWSGLSDSTPYDVQNFSYLLRDLRAAMDEYKSGLLLTAAVISSSANKFYQPTELNKYLDYVNIMTYDGNNTGLATHHTKPYGSGYSAKNAIELWINAGVDASKIVVGAAFYGKISELSTPVSDPQDALGKATISTSTVTYTKIYDDYMQRTGFRECYDSASGAYFLSDGQYFITYDNFYSIQSKADLIRQYGLAGMMFWDYGSDRTGQLMSAVYAGISALNN